MVIKDHVVNNYKLAAKVFANGTIDEIEALLRYDFDLSDGTWNAAGYTLLSFVVRNKNHCVIEKFEGKRFNVNVKNKNGRTVLWEAARYNNLSCLEFLFKHGADPNIRDVLEQTAFFTSFLEWASIYSNTPINISSRCVELFLEYGANILLKDHEGLTIFDFLGTKRFAIIQPVIAQVAFLEATGKHIEENILKFFRNNYDKFFNLCKRKIENLQKTKLNKTITLFSFLIESEDKLLRYVRNPKTKAALENIIYRERRSKIFFIKSLRKRVRNILKIAELKEDAILKICKISECSNQDVISQIVSFLDKQSLANLCQI